MKLRSAVVAFAVSMAPVLASAQDQVAAPLGTVLAVGTKVRLRSSAIEGQPRGIVASVDEMAVTLTADGGRPVTIPLASITALEASLGRRRNALQGLAIGAVSGALLGLAFNVDSNNCGDESDNFCSRGEAIGAGSFTFALLGTGIGALIKSERWGRITFTPERPRVGHNQPGFRVLVTVGF